jgi:hypothetical protein
MNIEDVRDPLVEGIDGHCGRTVHFKTRWNTEEPRWLANAGYTH